MLRPDDSAGAAVEGDADVTVGAVKSVDSVVDSAVTSRVVCTIGGGACSVDVVSVDLDVTSGVVCTFGGGASLLVVDVVSVTVDLVVNLGVVCTIGGGVCSMDIVSVPDVGNDD